MGAIENLEPPKVDNQLMWKSFTIKGKTVEKRDGRKMDCLVIESEAVKVSLREDGEIRLFPKGDIDE